MNFLIPLLLLLSVSASTPLDTNNFDQYKSSHEILDSNDFAVWNYNIGKNPDYRVVCDAINYTIKTNNLSLLEDIINEFEASEQNILSTLLMRLWFLKNLALR